MDFYRPERTTLPTLDPPVKHSLTLLLLLTLLLSLFAGTLAYGQSAQFTTLSSAQVITDEALPASPKLLRDGLIGTMRLWRASKQGLRARRWAHPTFHIQLGHRFSITIAQH